MSMSRKFKTADYAATLQQTIMVGEALPADHLARFVADVVAQLDLQAIYAQYGAKGGEAYAPEVLLALLLYGYASGVFSLRKIEQATHEVLPFRFVAGNLHPDHDTLAHFRKTFRNEIQELFVQVLLLAQTAGYLKLGNISLDGAQIHANASKSHAASYKRLLELEAHLHHEVDELFRLAELADRAPLPEGMNLADEVAIRQQRLARLAEAKRVLEVRAQERY
jgi:transposase